MAMRSLPELFWLSVLLLLSNVVPAVDGAHRFRHELQDRPMGMASFTSIGHVLPTAMRTMPGVNQHAPAAQESSAPGGHFNVLAFGAKGDGATDDTEAFAKALKAASDAGGGHVYAPPAEYLLKGNLTIPGGVALKGSYQVVPSHDCRSGRWANLTFNDGSVLIPTGGRGVPCDIDCTDAFIAVQANGVLQGFTIVYKEQERQALPVSYPWTIFMNLGSPLVPFSPIFWFKVPLIIRQPTPKRVPS